MDGGPRRGVGAGRDGRVRRRGVDIPLSVPTGAQRREAEILASARLGQARSSLFPTPPAPVLDAQTYEEACAAARAVTGKKISLQTWHIVGKIREFQQVRLPSSVVETHPELSFRTMAPSVAFASKKTARGRASGSRRCRGGSLRRVAR